MRINAENQSRTTFVHITVKLQLSSVPGKNNPNSLYFLTLPYVDIFHLLAEIIPITRHENAVTHTDWEGTGVIPNVYDTESNSLAHAQQLILQRQLANTTDEHLQRKIQWQLNYLKAQRPDWTPVLHELSALTGQFEEFEFAVRNGQFVCINKHQANKADRLIPITHQLFQVNASMQVAFTVNDQGVADTVKLYWNDGWVDTIRRTGP